MQRSWGRRQHEGGIQATPSLDWFRWCLKRRMCVDKTGWEILEPVVSRFFKVFSTIYIFFKTYNPFLASQISHRGTVLKRRSKYRSGVNLDFLLLCLHKDSDLCGCHHPSVPGSPVLCPYLHAPPFSMFLVALSPPLSSSSENSTHSTMWVPSCSIQA